MPRAGATEVYILDREVSAIAGKRSRTSHGPRKLNGFRATWLEKRANCECGLDAHPSIDLRPSRKG